MQFQADILGVPVIRPQISETTALGAAYLAGLAVGFWKSRDEIDRFWRKDREFTPTMPQDKVTSLRDSWAKTLERAKEWERP
jgi:glycerol kinase